MQVTDTIADLLTRIRNAQAAKHDTVEVPASNMKKAICQILVDEGYVKNFTVTDDGKQGIINITLKYGAGRTPVIKGLKRVSKPGEGRRQRRDGEGPEGNPDPVFQPQDDCGG